MPAPTDVVPRVVWRNRNDDEFSMSVFDFDDEDLNEETESCRAATTIDETKRYKEQ